MGKMLEAIETVLPPTKPNRILLQGDTNSSQTGDILASKVDVPTDHEEAGFHSFH